MTIIEHVLSTLYDDGYNNIDFEYRKSYDVLVIYPQAYRINISKDQKSFYTNDKKFFNSRNGFEYDFDDVFGEYRTSDTKYALNKESMAKLFSYLDQSLTYEYMLDIISKYLNEKRSMKTDKSKALYESIMRKVSKVVKQTLNESFGDEISDSAFAYDILNKYLKEYNLEGVDITDNDVSYYLYLVNRRGYGQMLAVSIVLNNIRELLEDDFDDELENEIEDECL